MEEKLIEFVGTLDGDERCGLILKRNRIVETLNVAEQPDRSFEIPCEELVRYEDKVKATWHTHPNAKSTLSLKDHFGFRQWPHLIHYIVGTDGVSAYKVVDGVVLNAD